METIVINQAEVPILLIENPTTTRINPPIDDTQSEKNKHAKLAERRRKMFASFNSRAMLERIEDEFG